MTVEVDVGAMVGDLVEAKVEAEEDAVVGTEAGKGAEALAVARNLCSRAQSCTCWCWHQVHHHHTIRRLQQH